ncbi:hypothetical protein BDW59DRAFT_166181 [Aspergillus cavernicola]|uniref:Uncharacterized protein n=1 Tax=Aspergillus cavernicola TaxID=176166 RepID=A0ABR4HMW9_9EURO
MKAARFKPARDRDHQQKRSSITIDEIFAPVRMAKKQGTEVDWSTAYAIGQSVASEFAKAETLAIFLEYSLWATAAHMIFLSSMSHAQPQARGMNITRAADPKSLLQSYVSERRPNAQQLIKLDRRWYNIQWADNERKKQPGYQDECTKLYQDVSDFTSGYHHTTTTTNTSSTVILSTVENDGGLTPNSGIVKPGKRLLNTSMMHLADGCQWDMHDNLIPNGDASFKVLVFCGRDVLLNQGGSRSAEALKIVFDLGHPCIL